MRNIIKNCPNEYFIEVFNKSNSISEIIKHFKLNQCGAQYDAVNNKIELLNLDKHKFDKTKWVQKVHLFNTIPLDKILVKESTYLNTTTLKERLLKEGKLIYNCAICNINDWLNKKLSLQLDHINGDRYDNRLENLRLLCPNCHSQSDTYAGKNKRKHTL